MVLVAQAPHAQTTPQPQPQAVAQAKAQANLAQAVRAAEQRSGGRARKVELENEKGVEVYEIKTVSKDKSACVLINRVTGDVVRVEGPGFMSGVFDREDQQEDLAELARLEASPLTLAAAIETAEQQTGGRAIGAELRNQYGSSVFEIRVVKDWEMQKVWVDPATSKVIPIPQKPKHDDD
jgi:uncharacterized membrane protein YkoI